MDLNRKKSPLREEFRSLGALVFNAEKTIKEIAFFASQAQYISYYQGLLDELLVREKEILYLTSELSDPILEKKRDTLTSLFSKSFLPLTFPMLSPPVLVTTIPDIQQYQIKRSFSGTNYVYVFHSLVSTHKMYRTGAFDYYDTIFCVGPHHLTEIRETEKVYNLPAKTLHEVGYYRLEKIHAEYQEYLAKKVDDDSRKLVLIAAGWQDDNILDTCADDLIISLLKEDFEVVFRPHPMTIEKKPELLNALKGRFAKEEHFQLDVKTISEKYLHAADVMICDWSGVALEYAYGTERPVLFVDLPPKVHNPEYEKIGIEPLEVRIRNEIGKSIQPEQASQAGEIVKNFINQREKYKEQIIASRKENIYNFGSSSKIGADIIEDILKKGIKGRVI